MNSPVPGKLVTIAIAVGVTLTILARVPYDTRNLNTDVYTQPINFESDEWEVARARSLEEEGKLIEAGFEHVLQ
jgi:hypothetical protein